MKREASVWTDWRVGWSGIVLLFMVQTSPLWGGDEVVRRAVFAGSWYPGEAEELASTVDSFLQEGPYRTISGRPVALVSPHAGYIYSGRAAGAVFRHLKGWDIERVIALAVNHRGPRFRGVSIPSVDSYETPLGRVPLDKEAIRSLRDHPLVHDIPGVHRREHSLELLLPFIQRTTSRASLVPMVVSGLQRGDQVDLARVIRPLLTEKTVVVVSSDFTHYGPGHGFVPFTEKIHEGIESLDRGAIDRILKLDLEGFQEYQHRTGATICGRQGISLLLALLPSRAQGNLVSYYLSADLPHGGDIRKNSVSYAAILFTVDSPPPRK